MTKKHFEALAAALYESRPRMDTGVAVFTREQNAARIGQWKRSVDAVADVCASTNHRFDRARFLAACGVEG